MSDLYRIHGDNIVECERFAEIIINTVCLKTHKRFLKSPSTIVIEIEFVYNHISYSWRIEMLPGFNKSKRNHWEKDIFQTLRDNGSFLDETPDVIITKVNNNNETLILAAEFCNALQAGNQAWQRSGRAFSTGRTGCPYLYIINLGNFELDPNSRISKSTRVPNPAVPYSYINYSKTTGNFVAQIYLKAENFSKENTSILAHFNENDFAEEDLSSYVIKKMCGLKTNLEEQNILRKLFNIVKFLAQNYKSATNFTPEQWDSLNSSKCDIIEFSINNSDFIFHKKIATKSQHGKCADFVKMLDTYSHGLASKDLPFGIIPSNERLDFAQALQNLYPQFSSEIITKIGSTDNNLIICLLKGFKPNGDDNRPDRGALPFAAMLSSADTEIMTYIYGPILKNNYDLLLKHPEQLAEKNGLWKSILTLSNYLTLDVPIHEKNMPVVSAENLIDTSILKSQYTTISPSSHNLTSSLFASTPLEYHEDDVDTGIHYTFSYLLSDSCFESICNPPGGDWSGISIIYNNLEERWLSLPRVSEKNQGKRPDHIYEIWGVFNNPLLLIIESKEKSSDLEPDVGTRLKNYVQHLMNSVPNAERKLDVKSWQKSENSLHYQNFFVLSAAAYLKETAQPNSTVFKNSNCDLLLVMEQLPSKWIIEIVPNTKNASIFKNYLSAAINNCIDSNITIK